MTAYATLAQAKAELKAVGTADDDTLMRIINQVSRRIDGMFRIDTSTRDQIFAPTQKSVVIPVRGQMITSALNVFTIPTMPPLLELTSVTCGTTALTIGTDVEAFPSGVAPIRQLRLLDYYRSWYGYKTTSAPLTMTINGVWGWRNGGAAWESVDTLQAAISDTTTKTFTVADVDGDDMLGISPRISRGSLVRIVSADGMYEYMNVTDTNTSTNVVTVAKRGDNGTTAALHGNGAAVEVWGVEPDITRAVVKQAGLQYARRGAYTTVEAMENGTEIRFPADLLTELRAIMQEFAYS